MICSEKAISCQETNPGHLVCTASVLPLNYDNWTIISPLCRCIYSPPGDHFQDVLTSAEKWSQSEIWRMRLTIRECSLLQPHTHSCHLSSPFSLHSITNMSDKSYAIALTVVDNLFDSTLVRNLLQTNHHSVIMHTCLWTKAWSHSQTPSSHEEKRSGEPS